jgi:hypothetical protein
MMLRAFFFFDTSSAAWRPTDLLCPLCRAISQIYAAAKEEKEGTEREKS